MSISGQRAPRASPLAGRRQDQKPEAQTDRRPRPRLLDLRQQLAHLGVRWRPMALRAAPALSPSTMRIRWRTRLVDVLFDSVVSALARGDRVVLRRFGTLYTSPRRTGKARNPRTGEPVDIPRGRVVRFRPAPGLQSFPSGS